LEQLGLQEVWVFPELRVHPVVLALQAVLVRQVRLGVLGRLVSLECPDLLAALVHLVQRVLLGPREPRDLRVSKDLQGQQAPQVHQVLPVYLASLDLRELQEHLDQVVVPVRLESQVLLESLDPMEPQGLLGHLEHLGLLDLQELQD